MEIDLVYLWVNGNDPLWAAKRDAFIGRPTQRQENCKGRYADSGELKYSLRSVERYAPWIRKIFIVTDNQVPEWLDTSNPRIQIVDHRDIMPAECLPCFNSIVIEYFLHRIPGLAEHFLYATDDMYINRPVGPSDFFTPDGRPVLYMNRKPLSQYITTVQNAARLVEREYGKFYGAKLHHNIDAYTKGLFELTHRKFGREISAMHGHHVRHSEDVQRVLFSYVALAEGLGELRYVGQRHSFRLHIDNRGEYAKFGKYHPTLFCMNDSEYANDADRVAAMEFVGRLFPQKCQFEK